VGGQKSNIEYDFLLCQRDVVGVLRLAIAVAVASMYNPMQEKITLINEHR